MIKRLKECRCNIVGLVMSALLLCGCGRPTPPAPLEEVPDRIISLAPNITEIIYALGLDDRLVGVTRFCTYPPAARNLPKIGGFGQFNYEAIVSLHPDLAIVHEEFDAEKTRLNGLGIPCLETGNYFIQDILESIRDVGVACGAEGRADELNQQLSLRMAALKHDPTERPRVLMTFSGNADDAMAQIHAFGTECLHNELLEMAGGENVLSGKRPYALLSKEAVLRLNPDVIMVLAPELIAADTELAQWKTLSAVKAVEAGRVYVLTNDYLCIPGPRFIRILEDMSAILGGHP